MDATGQNVPECPVRLRRCNRGSTARSERVDAVPRKLVTPVLSQAENHIPEYTEVPVVVIKTERDAEDSVTSQGHHTGYACPVENSKIDVNLVIKQEYAEVPVVVKTEYDAEDTYTPQGWFTGLARRPDESKADVSSVIKQEYSEVPVVVKTEYDSEDTIAPQGCGLSPTGLSRRLEGSKTNVSSVLKQDYTEVPVVVKTEYHDENTDTSQGGRTGLVRRLENSKGDVGKQEDYLVIKTEHEADETMVKQELDISPMVLQRQAAPCPPSKPAQTPSRACLAGPCPSTSSGGGVTQAPLYSVFSKPAQRTKVKEGRRVGDSGAPSDASSASNLRRTDDIYRRVFRRQLYVRSDIEDPSKGAQDEGQCRLDASDAKADAHHESDRYKYNTKRESDTTNHLHTGQKQNKPKKPNSATRSDGTKKPVRAQTGGKPYECDQCGYSTSHVSHLKRHTYTHTGKKPYKCEQCEYSASEPDSLKRHMRTHTGEKPYDCHQCQYSTSHVSHLKRHMRIHTGEKPYKCDRCGYSASEIGSLKRHVRIHTGEKPYKCGQCKYSASEIGSLKRHVRIHTSEKPYKCKQCEYSATQSGNLKIHMRTHTGKKSKECDQNG